MAEKNILVTGAGGFIGHALAQELIRQERNVVAYDLIGLEPDQVYYKAVVGDLTDIHRLHALFKNENISAVIHCGAISGPMLALGNPHRIIQVNVGGTANVLEAARLYGVECFVYCSSGSAYGASELDTMTEESPLFPIDVYGASKACGEHLVQAYAVQHGIDGISLRIPWVYGPHRSTDCVIRQMIADALDNRPTILGWGLTSCRQYIYIRDVVTALIAVLDQRSLPKAVYNISGEPGYISIGQAAEAVQRVLIQIPLISRMEHSIFQRPSAILIIRQHLA
jgi:nucleoside-diphosphate-sugar epimerase